MANITSTELLNVANTINRQSLATVENRWVYFSWGVSKKVATIYKDMPALALRVSGVYHKGWVYVCYNRGEDLYELYFVNTRGTEKKSYTGIYADQLGDIIDRTVERGDTSEEVYAKRAAADTQRKFAAHTPANC